MIPRSASTPNKDQSWPSQLAKRLAANKATEHWTIVNEGIGGNRLLADGIADSALARFDRDVLSRPGIKWVIVLEGINDIGVAALHLHGIKVAGGTLTPYEGSF